MWNIILSLLLPLFTVSHHCPLRHNNPVQIDKGNSYLFRKACITTAVATVFLFFPYRFSIVFTGNDDSNWPKVCSKNSSSFCESFSFVFQGDVEPQDRAWRLSRNQLGGGQLWLPLPHWPRVKRSDGHGRWGGSCFFPLWNRCAFLIT